MSRPFKLQDFLTVDTMQPQIDALKEQVDLLKGRVVQLEDDNAELEEKLAKLETLTEALDGESSEAYAVLSEVHKATKSVRDGMDLGEWLAGFFRDVQTGYEQEQLTLRRLNRLDDQIKNLIKSVA